MVRLGVSLFVPFEKPCACSIRPALQGHEAYLQATVIDNGSVKLYKRPQRLDSRCQFNEAIAR